MEVFIATMCTEHFEFQAIGSTKEAAIDAIFRGWMKHRGQVIDGSRYVDDTRIPSTIPELEDHYDIVVNKMVMNDCTRDGVPLTVY